MDLAPDASPAKFVVDCRIVVVACVVRGVLVVSFVVVVVAAAGNARPALYAPHVDADQVHGGRRRQRQRGHRSTSASPRPRRLRPDHHAPKLSVVGLRRRPDDRDARGGGGGGRLVVVERRRMRFHGDQQAHDQRRRPDSGSVYAAGHLRALAKRSRATSVYRYSSRSAVRFGSQVLSADSDPLSRHK